MRFTFGFATAIVALGTACAPIESATTKDEPINSRTVTGPGRNAIVTAVVQTSDEGGAIVIRSRETCEQHFEEQHQKTRVTERHGSRTTMAFLYGLGGIGAVTGTWVVLDAPNVPAAGDPNTMNPIGRSGAYTTGVGFLAVGGSLLAAAVATSIRARNGVEDLGSDWETRGGSSTSLTCNEKDVSGKEVFLVAGSTRISLGKTTSKGQLTFTWSSLQKAFDTDASPDSATLDVAGFGTQGQLDLSRGRAFWARRNLVEARRLAKDDEVDKAKVLVERAQKLLPDVDVEDANAAIAEAPTSIARARAAEEARKAERKAKEAEVQAANAESADHLKRAKAAIKRNDPDMATAELDEAERIACHERGRTECRADGEVTTLRHAVEETPKARQRAKDAEREAQHEAAVAARIERQHQTDVRRDLLRRAKMLGGQRCPAIYASFHDSEQIVTAINSEFSSQGGRLNASQAAAVVRAMGDRASFVKVCSRAVEHVTQSCLSGPTGVGPGELSDCFVERASTVLTMAPFTACALNSTGLILEICGAVEHGAMNSMLESIARVKSAVRNDLGN